MVASEGSESLPMSSQPLTSICIPTYNRADVLAETLASDTDVVPLVRVNPQYPERAAMRGVEGWVEVEFTIGRAGGVEDARVVRSEPSSIFNRAALRAIRKWKYNPKIEEGTAIERPGVRVRLKFELKDG